jgi:hypothetical protein
LVQLADVEIRSDQTAFLLGEANENKRVAPLQRSDAFNEGWKQGSAAPIIDHAKTMLCVIEMGPHQDHGIRAAGHCADHVWDFGVPYWLQLKVIRAAARVPEHIFELRAAICVFHHRAPNAGRRDFRRRQLIAQWDRLRLLRLQTTERGPQYTSKSHINQGVTRGEYKTWWRYYLSFAYQWAPAG